MATSDAPISIGRVTLTVRDLDRTAAFYESVIGLGLVERDGETALLGTDNKPLVELRRTEEQDRSRRNPACSTRPFYCHPNKILVPGWPMQRSAV